jgi:hypothetical protein
MRFQLSDPAKTEQLALVFMFTAYDRCGSELGMGFLQAVNGMSPLSIRKHLLERLSYSNEGWTSFSGDYIAGRMVKTGIEFEPVTGLVEIRDDAPRPDYQGWSSGVPSDPGVLRQWQPSSGKLDSYYDLLMTAAKLVGVDLTPVEVAVTNNT